MRSKTKTNHTLWAQFFPRFEQVLGNRPIRLTQCCTQFRSLGVKVLCVFHLHDNVAFTFKWYGNTWNKSFYSQRIWIGYNIELAEWVYSWEFLIGSSRCLPLLWLVGLITLVLICKPTLHRKKKKPNWPETDRVEPGTIQLLARAGLELTIYRLYCLYFCPRVMLKLVRKRRGHLIMTLAKITSDLID